MGVRAWSCAKGTKRAKQSERVDLIKIRHPTHVPYGEEKGSVEKAYLITRELNE